MKNKVNLAVPWISGDIWGQHTQFMTDMSKVSPELPSARLTPMFPIFQTLNLSALHTR
jgi:hypothetical protein